jgi:hypothetical protein
MSLIISSIAMIKCQLQVAQTSTSPLGHPIYPTSASRNERQSDAEVEAYLAYLLPVPCGSNTISDSITENEAPLLLMHKVSTLMTAREMFLPFYHQKQMRRNKQNEVAM